MFSTSLVLSTLVSSEASALSVSLSKTWKEGAAEIMSTVRLDEVLIANRLVYYCVLIIHHLVHCHWLLQLLELVSPSLGENSAADVSKCW